MELHAREAVSELTPEDTEGTENGGGHRGRTKPENSDLCALCALLWPSALSGVHLRVF